MLAMADIVESIGRVHRPMRFSFLASYHSKQRIAISPWCWLSNQKYLMIIILISLIYIIKRDIRIFASLLIDGLYSILL